MHTFRPIVLAAALAGLIVGIVISVAQQFGTVPLILQAEVYERAAEELAAAPVGALPAAAAADSAEAGAAHDHAAGAAHEHATQAWEPEEGLQRNAFTAAFNVIDWVGFGLVLTAALTLSRRQVDWREGFLWGLAGFVCVVVAPGLGLPPELPGIPAAALEPRQAWWIGTVAATAIALYLIAFGRSPLAAAGAIVLLALPHLIGAPELDEVATNVPEPLSHHFTVAVMMTTLLSWSLLGGLCGFFYQRFAASETVPRLVTA